MNIAFIYPRPNEQKDVRFGFSYDWALLATATQLAGHNVYLYDFSVQDYNSITFSDALTRNNIDIILIEFDSFSLKRSENYKHGFELVSLIKGIDKKIHIISYGHYPCITQKSIENSDITIKDSSLFSIIFSLNTLLPKSMQIRIGGFDEYPVIDRNLICSQVPFFNSHRHSSLVLTSTGCKNTCSFCQRKAWQNEYIDHSDEYVYNEFSILKDLGIINLWILDENFTFRLTRAKRILNGLYERDLTSNMKISLSSWVNIDYEFIDIAKKSNIKTISFGIESANKDILRFYKKRINLERAQRIINYADKVGIFTIGNFILGAPNESIKTIDETFSFINQCNFDQINIKTLSYLQGAPLYDTLQPSLKSQSAIFACKENNLTNFYAHEISNIKKSFLKTYMKRRFPYLMTKIKLNGLPYDENVI